MPRYQRLLLRAAVPAVALSVVVADGVWAQEARPSGGATVRASVRITPALDTGALPLRVLSGAFATLAAPGPGPVAVEARAVVTTWRAGRAAFPRRESPHAAPPLVRWLEMGGDGDRRVVRQVVAVAY